MAAADVKAARNKVRKHVGPVRDILHTNIIMVGKKSFPPREAIEHGYRGQRILVDVDPDGNHDRDRIWIYLEDQGWSWIHVSVPDVVRYWLPGDEDKGMNELSGAHQPLMRPEVKRQLQAWGELPPAGAPATDPVKP